MTRDNHTLKDAVRQVMTGGSPAQFTVELKFFSDTDPGFSFVPPMITEGRIVQDCPNGYYDAITFTFDIASADYAALYDRMQGLMVKLTLSFVDPYSFARAAGTKPIVRTCHAVIVDPRDLRRQLRDVQSRTTPDTQITVQLVEKDIYALRRKKYDIIYHNTDMLGVLRSLAAEAKIKTVHITPPDNTQVFPHVVIPPFKEFRQVFDYLQATHGVYMHGLDFYYTGEALYIFPPFAHKGTGLPTANLYQGDRGDYAGAPSFHKLSGDTLEIVATGEPQTQDLTKIAAENHGTAAVFFRSSQIVDRAVTSSEKGVEFAKNNAVTLRLKAAHSIKPDAVNAKYVTASDNVFAIASELAKYQAVRAMNVWPQAVPFLLCPGHLLKYLHDANGVMKSTAGVMEAVEYTITPQARTPSQAGVVYACAATLQFRLDPPTPTPA